VARHARTRGRASRRLQLAPHPTARTRTALQVFAALCGKLLLPLCQLAAAGSSAGSSGDGAIQEQLRACGAAAQQLLLSAVYHQAHVQGLAEGCSQQAAKVGRHSCTSTWALAPCLGRLKRLRPAMASSAA
jgi:hypothetical protein